MSWGAAVAVIGSSLVGNAASNSSNKSATKKLKQMMEQYSRVQVPTVEDQQLLLEEFQSAGLLTPEMESVILQGESAFNNVQEDPRLRDAQLQALTKLQEVSDSDGLDFQAKNKLNQAKNEASQWAKGNREAIQQSFERRGQGGSGQELAAQLLNSQSGANRVANDSFNVAALAEERALQSLMGLNDIGGNVRKQDFDIAARKAEATDNIRRFNTEVINQAAAANVDRVNNARAANLQNKQNLMNSNTDLRNKQQEHNKNLIQQRYQNELARLDGMSGNTRTLAEVDLKRGQQQSEMWGGIGQGVGQVWAASNQGKRKKEEDFE